MSRATESTSRFSPDELTRFTREILVHYGVDEERAAIGAEVLSTSDLRGIDSHGVARLWIYSKWLEEGHAKPCPNVTVRRETPSTIAMNGDNGLGIIVGPEVNLRVIEKADAVGSAWGTVSHSNHFGIAGYYSLQAVARDMIGVVFSNATAQMYPVGSFHPMLGTNPMSIAFPAGEEEPIVVDMATSAAAFGKIEIAHRAGKGIPEGWAVLQDGTPITDPAQVYSDPYALAPLGSTPDHSNHKGYCLASVADLFGGVLSGAAFGPHCPHMFFPEEPFSNQTKRGLGQCFSAMRVDSFLDLPEYRERVDQWIREFRQTPPSDPNIPVLIPGEPEWRSRLDRSANGIPLNDNVIAALKTLSDETGIRFPD